ncbi:hypothetical protein V6N13_060270 [Hibiscus sabdariffa]
MLLHTDSFRTRRASGRRSGLNRRFSSGRITELMNVGRLGRNCRWRWVQLLVVAPCRRRRWIGYTRLRWVGMWMGLESVMGPFLEGSNAEVVVYNGKKRKVRLLANVHSLQSPEEKLQAKKAIRSRGRGHPLKVDILSPEIVDISSSDSDLLHRKEALLTEAVATVDFGKLLGAKTIGSEEVIVQDIAWILVQSQ